MSWSVGHSGPSNLVAEELEKQFTAMESYPCPEPEETIKQRARQLIAVALGANVPPRTVSVGAYGGQSDWTQGGEDFRSLSLIIKIE